MAAAPSDEPEKPRQDGDAIDAAPLGEAAGLGGGVTTALLQPSGATGAATPSAARVTRPPSPATPADGDVHPADATPVEPIAAGAGG